MKWINGETWESERTRKSDWHKWFAWFPVVIAIRLMPEGKSRTIQVWLEYVERKGQYCSSWGSEGWEWEYREII